MTVDTLPHLMRTYFMGDPSNKNAKHTPTKIDIFKLIFRGFI